MDARAHFPIVAFTKVSTPFRTPGGRSLQHPTRNARSGDTREKNAKQDSKLSASVAEMLWLLGDAEFGCRSSKTIRLVAANPTNRRITLEFKAFQRITPVARNVSKCSEMTRGGSTYYRSAGHE